MTLDRQQINIKSVIWVNYFIGAVFFKMITDNRTPKNFKILTCNNKELTLFDGAYGKLIYREYNQVPKQSQDKLLKWAQFNHPYLLTIRQIQRIQDTNKGITLGLFFQHYSGSLQNYLTSHGFNYDQEEIVNTFSPIFEAIQYLHSQNYLISPIKLKNIVITQAQQVKFIDQSILDPYKCVNSDPQKQKVFTDIFKIYQQLSCLIFDLLISQSKGKKSKSWKNKLQLLKQTLTKQTYSFFLSIFNKSLINSNEPAKTKKIAKKKRTFQGKENHITQ